MRIARAGLRAALVVGVLALSAPVAAAAGESDGEVRISPEQASPGTTVTVTTTACGKEIYGKGESDAGGKFHLLEGDRKGVLVGEFQVPEDAESGTDTVTLKCPPRTKATAEYSIADRPSGALDAGFGDPGDKGSQLAVGSLLLSGAVVAGVVRARRHPTGVRV
ncbi:MULTISPECIES: sortase [unclassified Streptomyces]|uniref:sortase n=1 Tax=unclassified Streptomyces TaxID=2593676 RepID=UPI00333112EA